MNCVILLGDPLLYSGFIYTFYLSNIQSNLFLFFCDMFLILRLPKYLITTISLKNKGQFTNLLSEQYYLKIMFVQHKLTLTKLVFNIMAM